MKIQIILLILICSVMKANDPLRNYTSKFEQSNIFEKFQSDSLITDSTFQQRSILNKKIMKASLMSALLPGIGQWYNGSPAWKTAVFAGVEILGLYQYWKSQNSAEDLKTKYERFADENWDITRWTLNTATLRSNISSIENIVIELQEPFLIKMTYIYDLMSFLKAALIRSTGIILYIPSISSL